MEKKMEQMQRVVQRELFAYPVVSRQDRLKRIVRKYLLQRKGQEIDRYSWPNALLVIALQYRYDATHETEILDDIKKYLTGWMSKDKLLTQLEHVLNGYCLLWLYEVEPQKEYEGFLHKIFEFLCQYPKDRSGSLPYAGDRNLDIYADGIGMICPFLYRYGKLFHNTQATEMACTQIMNYIQLGLDKKTGLPYHGYNVEENLKKGIIGWGRATGWLLMGMADMLEWMDEKDAFFKKISEYLEHLIGAVLCYQRRDGQFPWQLEAEEGPPDTSATAMILYSVKKADKERKKYAKAIEKGENVLISLVRDGYLSGSSAECQGFGEYPQKYGKYPWGTGPLFALINL